MNLTPVPVKIKAGEIGIINLATVGMPCALRLKKLVEEINASYRMMECDDVPQVWIITLCNHPFHQYAVAFVPLDTEELLDDKGWGTGEVKCVGEAEPASVQYMRTVEELEMYLTGHALALEQAGLN